MSATIMNGHSDHNGEVNDVDKSCDTDVLLPSKVNVENGFTYSPLVTKKPLLDSSNLSLDSSNVGEVVKITNHVLTTTSTSQQALQSSDDEAVVVSQRVIKTTTTTKTTRIIKSSEIISGDDLNESSDKIYPVTEQYAAPSLSSTSAVRPPSPKPDKNKDATLIIRSPQYNVPTVGDRVKPASSLVSTRPDVPVLLRYTKSGPLSDSPILITTMLERTVTRFPELTALAVKRNNEWKKWSHQEMLLEIRAVAKALIALGLERCHGVGILGFNSPEWFMANFAAIYAGGLSTGIYATNNPEACEWPLKDCQANICVVENDKQLEKILKVWPNLPDLKAVIQWTGKPNANGHPNVYTWAEAIEKGRKLPDKELEKRVAELAPNMCSTLIYTSGTTGNPKGVMLSHDNLTWTAKQCATSAEVIPGEEICVSYLPLSHIAAQLIDIYIPFTVGATVYFAQPDALRGSLGQTLSEVRPTILLGVPRVWEKIQEKMVELGSQAPAFKRSIVRWAKSVGLRGNIATDANQPLPFGWNLANALVFKKVRIALGLDRCKLMFTGAAPIMTETLEFFRSLNLRILDAYGMSECSAPHTIQWPKSYKFGSSGRPILGAITHIDKPGDDGSGEICMEGRHVFMGYLYNEEKTREALDDNGWLHSGDVGKVDKEGFLYITGRIKELIITAGGENVPPIPIEDALKNELPVISQAMLIGDRRKFLSVLLTLKTDVDPDTMVPRDKLAPVTQQWATSLGSKSTRISEILDKTDLPILKAIQAAIDKVNERSTSQAQRIQKWTLLPRDFSIPGGELGPTMKLRRPIVTKMYKETIESFYV